MSGRKIFSNSAALLSLELVSKTLPLVTFPMVARALGPAIFGKVGFAISLASFFGLMVSSGFPTYGIKEVAQNPGQARALVSQLVGARVFFAGLAYFLLMLFVWTLAPDDAMTRSLMMCAGLSLFVSSLDLQWFFTGMSRMWVIASAGILSQIVSAALTVTLIYEAGHAMRLVLISVLSPMVAGLFLLFRTRDHFKLPQPLLRPRHWSMILPACTMLSLAGLMSQIYDQLDLILLRYFSSDIEVGMYAASCRVMGVALSFIFFIGQVYFPLICYAAKVDSERERRYLQLMWNTIVMIALPLTIGGVIFARPLTLLILGEQYAEASVIVRWLMPNVMATALAIYFGGRLITHRREKKYLISVGAAAACNIIFNIILMPFFGAVAAAVTTMASQLVVAGLAGYYSRDLPRHRSIVFIVTSFLTARITSSYQAEKRDRALGEA